MKKNYRIIGYFLILLGIPFFVFSGYAGSGCDLFFPSLPQNLSFINIFFNALSRSPLWVVFELVGMVFVYVGQKRQTEKKTIYVVLDFLAVLLFSMVIMLGLFLTGAMSVREPSAEHVLLVNMLSLRAQAEIYNDEKGTYGTGNSCNEGDSLFTDLNVSSAIQAIESLRATNNQGNFCYVKKRTRIDTVSCLANDSNYIMWASYKEINKEKYILENKIFCIDSSGFGGFVENVPTSGRCK